MKKLLVIIAAVALLAAPAAAADWNFYGSARMATFFTSDDFGDFDINGVQNGPDDDDDSGLQWSLQGNSRLGARVKGENVDGRIEIAIKGTDSGGGDVSSRLVYGVWDFGAGKLKVGKDYTPVSQFISTQTFAADLGLLGVGTFYGFRQSQIALSFGNFTVALIDPLDSDITTAGGVSTGNDVDSYIPKVEAGWGMAFDAFNFNVMGGFQFYTLEDQNSSLATDDVDVTAWVVGADAGFSFGPAYIKGAVSMSQNPTSGGWYVNQYSSSAGAFWDGDDDTDDTDVIMAALVAGFKMSDMVSFEVGGGMADIDTDTAGTSDTTPWSAYANATVQLAPGVWVIPEVGYFDFDSDPTIVQGDDDAGSQFYIGGKWQIDF